MISQPLHKSTVGLMLSGGLDSAVLLAHLLDRGQLVQPFYVATGCAWETDERQAVDRFLTALDRADIAPVVDLVMPTADLYGAHWSVTGHNVPDAESSDEQVLLPGRNPLLLLKPMLWCVQHGITQLALATLASNPFADATPVFFDQFQLAISTATEHQVTLVCPFSHWTKAEVLQCGENLPLELTFSCLSPVHGLHCGACNKCAERRRALEVLPVGDPTDYATSVCA